MSNVPQRIDTDLKEALKARDELKLSVVRMIKASLKNRSIEKMAPLTDDEVISVLSTMSKQRRESIEQFANAGRSELAEKEKKELEIIQSYMPAQLSAEDIDEIIRAAIAETGASQPGDMGKVMKIVASKTKGLADGKAVNRRVGELLSSGS